MKTMFAGVLTLVLFIVGTPANASEKDIANWGNTGAAPAPVKDETRTGYWWWPTEAASNTNDTEIWGNQGVVYNKHTVAPKEEAIGDPPTPPPSTSFTISCSWPVLSHILFAFDKSTLKPEGKVVLDQMVVELKVNPKDTVVIQGHTCDTGDAAYNLALGQRRAEAVMQYLIENGIAADRLSAISLGETAPAVPNDSPQNRKLNRRVQFEFTLGSD